VRVLRWVSLLALPASWGCSTVTWERSVAVASDHRMAVEVEEQRFEGVAKDAGFAHPAVVDAAGLSTFLLYLKYEYPGLLSKSIEPVVFRETIEPLSLAIVEGLKRCSSAQRVRFAVTNVHTQLKFLPVGKKTRGVAFVAPEGALNVAFDLIDDEPETDPRDTLDYQEWENPTRRTISTYRLVLPPGCRLYRDPEGDEQPLWVVIPLETITPQERPLSPADAATPAPPAPAGSPPPQDGAAAPVLRDQERVYRLRYLQDLYERKIISEEEYKREWKKIFEEY
jgi:hypothetical protein